MNADRFEWSDGSYALRRQGGSIFKRFAVPGAAVWWVTERLESQRPTDTAGLVVDPSCVVAVAAGRIAHFGKVGDTQVAHMENTDGERGSALIVKLSALRPMGDLVMAHVWCIGATGIVEQLSPRGLPVVASVERGPILTPLDWLRWTVPR